MRPAVARPRPAHLPLWAPAYVERFRCLGGACEAHCCGGWTVPVDRLHYVTLKKSMDGSPAERERFRSLVVRNTDLANERHHAFLVRNEAGDCALLDEHHLCSVHATKGEALLPDICSLYPRRVMRLADRLELELQLSCPEAARLLLLDEAAPRLAAVPLSVLPRPGNEHDFDPGADDYARFHDDLRGFALEVLALDRFPVETRLFFLTFLGQRTRPFLHRGIRGDVSEPLAAELAQLSRPEVQDELARSYAALAIPAPLAELVTLSLLGARLVDVDQPFRELVGAAVRGLLPGTEGAAGLATTGAALMARYREARAALPEVLTRRLDRHLTRFAEHHVLTRPYAGLPDLLVYAQDVALRVALVRLLVVGHPRTRAAVSDGASDGVGPLAALDAAAVETVFRFARAIDHSPAFLRAIGQRLEDSGMIGFPWAVALTRF